MPISDSLLTVYMNDAYDSTVEDEYEVLCITKETQNRMDKIREAIKKDKSLMATIHQGWPDRKHDVLKNLHSYFSIRHELIGEDKIIFKANRIVIPYDMRNDILGAITLSTSLN